MLKRINQVYWLADDIADLEQIKNPSMGTECFVIAKACEYKATSDGRWIKQVKTTGEASDNIDIDLSNYITREEFENQALREEHFYNGLVEEVEELKKAEITHATKEELNELDKTFTNTLASGIFGADQEELTGMGNAKFGLVIKKEETTTLAEAMFARGFGLYTLWIGKGNPDLPAEVLEKNSSVRGLCCVDTMNDGGNWYGWANIYDHDGVMYTRYIRSGVPSAWHKCSID